tara:strand:+ start:8447 stop:9157 length:711 start_codon:yes stop_codon:yes gene_type:complete
MYLGGKSRLAKSFAWLLQAEIDAGRPTFVEPFVGACNVLPVLKVPSGCRVILNDAHEGLVGMWRALRDGEWSPPHVDEATYDTLRRVGDMMDPDTVFAAFGASFAGKCWGGFARGRKTNRDYAAESSRATLRKRPYLKGASLHAGDYRETPIPDGAVVYCDPPYAGTTGYTHTTCAREFWAWCEGLVARGCAVFVSEFDCPVGWVSPWSLPRRVTASLGVGCAVVERVYARGTFLA